MKIRYHSGIENVKFEILLTWCVMVHTGFDHHDDLGPSVDYRLGKLQRQQIDTAGRRPGAVLILDART